MLTLALNSATNRTGVALVAAGKVLAEKTWTSKKDEAGKILPAIEMLLKKSGKQWQEIGELFVVNGPGPFTGLRIGITTANVLAWTLHAALKSADVFRFLTAQLPPKFQKGTAIVIKGGGDRVAVLAPKASKNKLIPMDELGKFLKKFRTKYVLADLGAEDLKKLRKRLSEEKSAARLIKESELKTFGKTVVEIAKTAKRKSKFIKPLYLQKPHITKSKKEVFTTKIPKSTKVTHY